MSFKSFWISWLSLCFVVGVFYMGNINETENWLFIDGYESLYMVSDLGRVKRVKSKNCVNGDRFLVLNKMPRGRVGVTLSKCGVHKTMSVNRLVAIAFIPNPNNLPVVCHIDDNPSNNRKDNLWWGTQKDNIIDCHKKGRNSNNLPPPKYGAEHHAFGKPMNIHTKIKMSNSKKKYSEEFVNQMISEYNNGATIASLSRKYNINRCYLSSLVNRKYVRY